MAFCSGCGADVPAGSAFCKQCGRPVAAGEVRSAPVHHSNPGSGAPATAGIAENVAGALCYSLWLAYGNYFPGDRQTPQCAISRGAVDRSIWCASHLLSFILGSFSNCFDIASGGLGLAWLLVDLVWLVSVVLWIFLMFKAYQGEQFRVPIAANIADSLVGKTPA